MFKIPGTPSHYIILQPLFSPAQPLTPKRAHVTQQTQRSAAIFYLSFPTSAMCIELILQHFHSMYLYLCSYKAWLWIRTTFTPFSIWYAVDFVSLHEQHRQLGLDGWLRTQLTPGLLCYNFPGKMLHIYYTSDWIWYWKYVFWIRNKDSK